MQSLFCCAAKQTVLATALLIPIMHLSEHRYEREGDGWKIDRHGNKWQAARLSAHSGRPSQGGTGKWTRQRRGRHRGGHEEGTSCYPESYKKGRFTQQLGHAEKNLVLCCLQALISFSFKDWSQIHSICSLRAFKGSKSGLISAFLAENLYYSHTNCDGWFEDCGTDKKAAGQS